VPESFATQHLHGGNQLGGDAIRNQVGEALFFRQYVADTFDFSGSVLDPDHDDAALRIRERHDGSQDAFRGGKIALELQGFAFVPAEEGLQIHYSAFYSEVAAGVKLLSRTSE
jgi:hypothetical protein